MSRSRRYPAAITAAILTATAGIAVVTATQSQAAPEPCSGVWVAVQFDDGSEPSLGCATEYATGLEALESAGFTAELSGGMLVRIDGKPGTAADTLFWATSTAPIAADGSVGEWTARGEGVTDTTNPPTPGRVEGFRYTTWETWPPLGPELASVPVSTTTTTTSESGSPTTTVTTTTTDPSPTVTTTTTLPPETTSPTPTVTTTTSAPASARPSAAKAAAFIAANLPGQDDGVGALIDAALGLAAPFSCAWVPEILDLVEQIEAGAPAYVEGQPGRAAKLSILVSALGLDPHDFAGLDLPKLVTDGTTDGLIGPFPGAFAQSLAIIALVRADADVPANMVTGLLSFQDAASGAFGFEWEGFTADPDSTALAIQALIAVGGHADAMTDALAWAAGVQTPAGYWENFSPVDSTGLLASSIALAGGDVTSALTWLAGKQLSDGGFPNSLDAGTDSNLASTVAAQYAAAGTSLLTIAVNLECDSSPGDGDDQDEELPNTGASDATGMLGIGAVVLVAAGGALVALRRTRQKH
ncbi:MAG: terpene cyclase/mutase family protein [Propionibacteriaceae bacterium]|nr:terpene cyclase/mutase family protein [Propionibacteriaceae bacterium]